MRICLEPFHFANEKSQPKKGNDESKCISTYRMALFGSATPNVITADKMGPTQGVHPAA
jgi:hypothetical protein